TSAEGNDGGAGGGAEARADTDTPAPANGMISCIWVAGKILAARSQYRIPSPSQVSSMSVQAPEYQVWKSANQLVDRTRERAQRHEQGPLSLILSSIVNHAGPVSENHVLTATSMDIGQMRPSSWA